MPTVQWCHAYSRALVDNIICKPHHTRIADVLHWNFSMYVLVPVTKLGQMTISTTGSRPTSRTYTPCKMPTPQLSIWCLVETYALYCRTRCYPHTITYSLYPLHMPHHPVRPYTWYIRPT